MLLGRYVCKKHVEGSRTQENGMKRARNGTIRQFWVSRDKTAVT